MQSVFGVRSLTAINPQSVAGRLASVCLPA